MSRYVLATCFLSTLFFVAPRTGAGEDDLDGPNFRSTTSYSVRAQITDYTTYGNPGAQATITIRRGTAYTNRATITANRNQSVSTRTPYAGRVYDITCQYRGRTKTVRLAATARGAYVNFQYTYDGKLYASY